MTVKKNHHQQIIVAALGIPVSLDKKKILMTQRHAPGNPAWHHKWQLAGGALDFSETPEEGAIREIMEELHVEAKLLNPQPIVKTNIWYANETDEKKDSQIVLIAYLVDIGSQSPDLTHDPDWETAAFGWFTLDEARKLDSLPMTLDIVEEAFKILANDQSR